MDTIRIAEDAVANMTNRLRPDASPAGGLAGPPAAGAAGFSGASLSTRPWYGLPGCPAGNPGRISGGHAPHLGRLLRPRGAGFFGSDARVVVGRPRGCHPPAHAQLPLCHGVGRAADTPAPSTRSAGALQVPGPGRLASPAHAGWANWRQSTPGDAQAERKWTTCDSKANRDRAVRQTNLPNGSIRKGDPSDESSQAPRLPGCQRPACRMAERERSWAGGRERVVGRRPGARP